MPHEDRVRMAVDLIDDSVRQGGRRLSFRRAASMLGISKSTVHRHHQMRHGVRPRRRERDVTTPAALLIAVQGRIAGSSAAQASPRNVVTATNGGSLRTRNNPLPVTLPSPTTLHGAPRSSPMVSQSLQQNGYSRGLGMLPSTQGPLNGVPSTSQNFGPETGVTPTGAQGSRALPLRNSVGDIRTRNPSLVPGGIGNTGTRQIHPGLGSYYPRNHFAPMNRANQGSGLVSLPSLINDTPRSTPLSLPPSSTSGAYSHQNGLPSQGFPSSITQLRSAGMASSQGLAPVSTFASSRFQYHQLPPLSALSSSASPGARSPQMQQGQQQVPQLQNQQLHAHPSQPLQARNRSYFTPYHHPPSHSQGYDPSTPRR